MPTSVKSIEDYFGVTVCHTVKWREKVPIDKHGIYIISTSHNTSYLPQESSSFVLSAEQISLWRKNAPDLTLQNNPITNEELISHLRKFWLPDESILYIGKAERETLKKRISRYYRHKIGKRSPHCGGYWLKLLDNLSSLNIHLIVIENNNISEIEERMLQYFINNVSPLTKELLLDKELRLPFANLQLRAKVIKKHGLLNHVI